MERPRSRRRGSRLNVPPFDAALDALLSGQFDRAAALFAARAIADPTDWISRSNRAIALYEAGRWCEAEAGFMADIKRGGWEDLGTVPALFAVGRCRLELGDYGGSLAASAAFLDLANQHHPFYAEAIENIASALEHLGRNLTAKSMRRRRWRREQIIAACFRILGVAAIPRLPREVDWYAPTKRTKART